MTPAAAAGAASKAGSFPSRPIVYRTRGHRHGPIVRLLSPSDHVAELIKPFVFLDHVDVGLDSAPRFAFHPHSGIATLTLLLQGGFSYEDSTGATGTMREGAVEWMRSGSGVWHTGRGIGERIHGYQLWVAPPPEHEGRPAMSRYLEHEMFAVAGPARVILGELEGVRSPITAPSSMNYLHVQLKPGEVWRYQPPPGHDVAWIAVYEGKVLTPDTVSGGDMVVFEASEDAISFRSQGDAGFVLGSGARHPHDLVLGNYSVHTNDLALERGEANIQRLGQALHRAGKF
jgi:redox-sensitive bicupin YhaK (pirin superfamily)